MTQQSFEGVGLGLRLPLIEDIKQHTATIDFLELAPENWINVGGKRLANLQALSSEFPLICHGLSLSLGAPAPLNIELLHHIKEFLARFNIACYSEHLSYCSDRQGYLYDLLPIPFTEEAVHYVSERIKQTQDILQRSIALENISYYCAPAQELSELDFINAVIAETNCELLLDVNNVYVNSVNHNYNAKDFIKSLTPHKIAYIHIAGHYDESESLKIDTHGEDVTDPVWDLLAYSYELFGNIPTLLERDSNFPEFSVLLNELKRIHQYQEVVHG